MAAAAMLTASLVHWPLPVAAATVTSEQAACDVIKARVAARGRFSVSAIRLCDVIVPEAQPRDYYVLALQSKRQCEGICSTHMGWFAVHRASGRVYEWDINDNKPRALVTLRR